MALPPPLVEFGTGASPVLAEGKVFLLADQDVGSYLLAVDAETGAEVWRVARPEFRRSFSTPFVWRHDGTAELVAAGSLWVRAYDLKDGSLRWSAAGMARVSNATPIAAEGLLFVSSWNVGGDEDDRVTMEPFEVFAAANDANRDGVLGKEEFPKGPIKDRFSQMDADKDGRVTREEYQFMSSMFTQAVNQLFAIRPGGKGDITGTHVVWQVSRHLPYVSSPIYSGGRVFSMKNGGLFSCYEARTGRPFYQAERVDAAGDYYSSAVAAADRIYVASQRGVVVVLDAKSDSLHVLARNDLHEPIFASPAIVDGVLYLRTEKHLYAFKP
jgi:outer membrane protein assembly factor BamB